MLKLELEEVRSKLNKMIENGEKKEEIYKVSTELDELIVQYYMENNGGKDKN